jgi:hypothetical protein
MMAHGVIIVPQVLEWVILHHPQFAQESTLVTTDKTDLTSIAYPRLLKIAGSDAKSSEG